MSKYLLFLVFLLCKTNQPLAQVLALPYQQAGVRLEQLFNGLPVTGTFSLTGKGPYELSQLPASTTGLQGWYIIQLAGNQPNINFSTSTGSATGSGVYSYGASGNNNRALGSLAAGSGVYAFGLVLKNETGMILNRIQIRLLATQWRRGGSGNKNTWRFGYQYADSIRPGIDTLINDHRFNLNSIHSGTGAATLNGHLPVNQIWMEDSITNIHWLPGQELVLQWDDFDETGSDDAMAIDDFSFKAYQQTALPVISAVTTDSIGPHNALLKAMINDQLLNTLVEVQLDTASDLSTAFTIQQINPPTISAGSGNVWVRASLEDLLPAKKYYYRFVASNQQGITYGAIQQFFTKAVLPVVQTDSIFQTTDNSCTVLGSIKSDGGDAIQEIGICWSTDSLPTIHHNSILIAGSGTNFQATVHQLPSGTKIFFRAYCKNSAGIAYGNILSLFSPTTILSFKRNGVAISNKDTIVYEIQFKEKVKGISTDHFQLLKDPGSIASIIEVTEKNFSWQIVINTGDKDGDITPVFLSSQSYEPTVINVPYTANTTVMDKKEPMIRSVCFANRSYKSGDTIHVFINTNTEKGLLHMITGSLSGYSLQQFSKINDSSWKAICLIKNGGLEINAGDSISASILLSDEAGNRNSQSVFIITQNNDAIDLTRPLINRILVPGKSLYKSGDSLFVQIEFSEAVFLDSSNGAPVLAVTIGTRIRNPFLYSITNNNLFTFCYVIQPDEIDMDGIRIANTITLNNAIIADIAGNILNNTIANAGIFSDTKVDAVAPTITNVITPIARTYGIGDSLYFHVFLSEAIIIPETQQLPCLEITVGNMVYQANYLPGNNNTLRFYWIVQKETSDKNGLSIRNLLLNCDAITDSSGNNIVPILKSVGSLSNVFVDGIVPVFKDSVVVAQVCSGNMLNLAETIQFNYAEQNELLSWAIVSAPENGSIQGFPFSSRFTSGNSFPSTIYYTPAQTEVGFDEFIIQVSDGVNKSFQKIKVQINPQISNNTIGANQIICAGFSANPLQGNLLKGGNGVYHFIWESADGSTNIYQKANGISDKEIYHPLNLNSTTKFRRIVSSGACSDTSASIVIDVRNNGLWLGLQSNNWNSGSNWCGGFVPNLQTDVLIGYSDKKNIIQINDSAFCRSLFIDTSNLLLINATLSFTGILSGANTIDAKKATIISSGKDKQILHTEVFTHKSVGGLIAAGHELELADSLYVSNYFSVQKGIFNTNDRLIPTQNAVNHPNAPGTGLKGKILVRRNFFARQKELLLHHPFKDNISMQFPADSLFTLQHFQPVNKNASIIEWLSISTNSNFAWPSGKGIVLTRPGSPSFNSEPVLLFFRGTAVTGDAIFEFGAGFDSSYVFTGNPYLSSINSKHINRSDGIGNYYWVWDTSFAQYGAYRAKAFSANNTIQMFDGYIIKTILPETVSLSYSEQAKLMTNIPDSLEGLIENTHQLEITLLKDNIIHDKLLILDVDSARTRYDATDAEKIINPESNLYSLSADTIPLSVDARWMTNRTYIPLGIDTKTSGQFVLTFSRVWLKTGIHLELQDLYTGNKIKIDTNKSYQFSITPDNESFGRNRFVIRAPQQPEPPDEVLQLQLYPVPVSGLLIVSLEAKHKALTTILIRNLQGQVLISKAMGEQQVFTQQIPVSGLLKGNYIVEVHSGKYVIAKNFIKL
jgi:hypothetical protein